MRLDVTQLLREPTGTQVDVEFDLGLCDLADDLAVRAIQGQVNLVRIAEGIWAGGALAIEIELQCARCLDPVVEIVQAELDERFEFPPLDVTQGVPVYPIDADKHIDLRPVVWELAIVSTPMHALCRPDCLGLCPECGKNLNRGLCDCQPDDVDPRLAVLKALLNDGVEE